MYDELVNLLRRCGKQKCKNCEYEHVLGCVTKMNEKAADAIVELSMKLHGDEAAIAGMQREIERMVVADKPGWIPVTERLPDDRRDVQITVFWHDAWRTMYGYYDGASWHLYAPMHTEVADVEVIGWMEKPVPMPLPQPPKEERFGETEQLKQEYYHAFCSRCGRPVIAKKEEAFWWPGGTTDDHLCISCDACGGLAEV